MKALCWQGKKKVTVETVEDPKILNPHDIIVRTTSTAICGTDLHLYHGFMPTMEKGTILGHEFMGEVVEIGPEVKNLKVGDRVVVPATIGCGHCHYCQTDQWSLCDNSNPNAGMMEMLNGFSSAAVFGHPQIYGGYAGGQAEYVRVPYGDSSPLKVESNLPDEQILFLSDIFPTGYMAAENCEIKPHHTIAVWGCGPVGQFAIRSAYLLGAHRVIAIDREPERLQMAEQGGAMVISSDDDVHEILKEMTGGRGPDACIDAVGMEAHGSAYDAAKQTLKLELDRPFVLRQAIRACSKGGVLSVPGAYAGMIDKLPFGAAFAKGLTIRSGATHIQRYMKPLLEHITEGRVDPSFVITHRMQLTEAPEAYDTFANKRDGCVKVVLTP